MITKPLVRLADYCNFLVGYPFESERFTDSPEDIPLVKGSNLSHQMIDWNTAPRWPKDDITKLEKYFLEVGDIVLAMDRPIVQDKLKFAWIKSNDPETLLVQRVARLRGINGLHTNYLRYLIANRSFLDHIRAVTTGVNIPHISGKDILRFRFILPGEKIQHRIASILSAYDDLIENNNRRIALLEESMQLLYKEWFVHFRFPGLEHSQTINGVPDGWVLRKLLDVTQYINRGISPKYGENETRWVINQKCIRDGRLNTQLARTHTSEYSSVKEVQFGDVLVNSTGIGTLGRVTQVYEELKGFTVDSHVTIVRPNEKVCVDYFGLYLLTLQPYFDQMGAGSTGQTELSRGSVANADFLLPPFSLQEKFGTLVSPQRHLVQNLLQQNKQLAEARDLLLPRLMSGEIPV